MKAEEFLKEKYKKGGCYPWSQFDYSEMVANMEEFAQQQLKNCNLQNVSQQRELLFAFGKYLQKRNISDFTPQMFIDDFLSEQ